MGVPEPISPLWTAVKSVHDCWPPDDEVVARALGEAWRSGGTLVAGEVRDVGAAGGHVLQAWADDAGTAFHDRADLFVRSVSAVLERTEVHAAQGDHYANELVSAKQAITATISANESTYALLGNPLLGGLGPALQNAFAAAVATQLQGMIAEKAAVLRTNPAGTAPAPAPASSSPGIDDFLAGGLRRWGELDQLAWRTAGEAVDNLVDGLGARGGELLRGLGNAFGNEDLARQGDAFEAAADANGDVFAEEALGIGADNSADIFDAATGIDGDEEPATVYISSERYPESAAHIDAAQSGTSYRGHEDTAYAKEQDRELTVDRKDAAANRRASLREVPPETGYDRDEYPPATFDEGGKGASVRYVSPSDNRGAGASMGSQMRHYPVEDSVERQTRRLDEGESVIIETN